MPTPTAFHHPKAAQQKASAFLYRAKVRKLDAAGDEYEDFILNLRAAYRPAEGGIPEAFEGEAPSADKVLILGWYRAIEAKQQLVLTWPDGVTTKHFYINDRLGDSAIGETLLIVSPWEGGV